MIEIRNLTFFYPGQEKPALEQIELKVEKGSFCLLAGPSGSGKTTLLKLLKKEVRPQGTLEGDVWMDVLSEKTGFVGQHPDLQLVTGKVWQELAFGLENRHLKREEIHKKVAEIAAYFGISSLFFKNTAELSGGQKQLLVLASVMVMEPEVLLLDEPGAQLDPVAYERFLDILQQLNRDFGTTILLSEHRLERTFSYAESVLFLQEGRAIAAGCPRDAAALLYGKKSQLTALLPAQVRIFYESGAQGQAPLTTGEGAQWISSRACGKSWSISEKNVESREVVLQAKALCFSYSGQPLLEELDLKVRKGDFYAVLGGNGAGKTTLLKLLAGVLKPGEGKVKVTGKICGVSQNPQAAFTEPTVEEELAVMGAGAKETEEMLVRLGLEGVRANHPYDISGGQMQRLALGKALLLKPDILLLDEPTKGLDGILRQQLGTFLQSLSITILMVSHDVEFCAAFASRGALLFGGQLVAEGNIRELLSQNRFYTTAVGKMAGRDFPGMLLLEECLEMLGSRRAQT